VHSGRRALGPARRTWRDEDMHQDHPQEPHPRADQATILGDRLVLEYAGALRPAQVRAAVSASDHQLPAMPRFPRARFDVLEMSVRRRLTERVARSRGAGPAAGWAAAQG